MDTVKAIIEVEWTPNGDAKVPVFLEAICDLVMTTLVNLSGVKDPSVAATLNGATTFRDPPPKMPADGMCPHARPSWRSCPHCLGINS